MNILNENTNNSNPVKSGKVYLVGAGPGDVDLLTVKAKRILLSAKTVVYDRLVGEDIMALISKDAKMIDVGKNVGFHPIPQEEISQILVDEARLGTDVVRLKGGDSFVFGRGGEELELLSLEGIDFEVVPGLTSGIASPAYAGIPVTHRDYCSSLHLITGHKKKDGELNIDFESLVKVGGTLLFFMSVGSTPLIAKGLLSANMSEDTPCCVIQNGTRAYQKKFLCQLSTLEATVKENSVISPSMIVVGGVCSLSDKFDWFSRLELKGRKILVTTPNKDSNRLYDALKLLGADAQNLPAIETVPISFDLPKLEDYSHIVFTSPYGVNSYFKKFFAEGGDIRNFSHLKFAVVGRSTKKALSSYGICADFVPSVYCGETLAKEMLDASFVDENSKVLILRAKKASEELTNILQNANIFYNEVKTYETIALKYDNINVREYEAVTFTSASSVEAFVSLCEEKSFTDLNAICIGEQTAKVARKYNMNTFVSEVASIDSMVEEIKKFFIDK